MADTFTKIYKFYASTHISINNTDKTFFWRLVFDRDSIHEINLSCPFLGLHTFTRNNKLFN